MLVAEATSKEYASLPGFWVLNDFSTTLALHDKEKSAKQTKGSAQASILHPHTLHLHIVSYVATLVGQNRQETVGRQPVASSVHDLSQTNNSQTFSLVLLPHITSPPNSWPLLP